MGSYIIQHSKKSTNGIRRDGSRESQVSAKNVFKSKTHVATSPDKQSMASIDGPRIDKKATKVKLKTRKKTSKAKKSIDNLDIQSFGDDSMYHEPMQGKAVSLEEVHR